MVKKSPTAQEMGAQSLGREDAIPEADAMLGANYLST